MTYSRAEPCSAGSRTELCQHGYPLRLELSSTEVSFAHLQSATFSYYSLRLELSSTELSLTHLTVSYIQLHSTGLILDYFWTDYGLSSDVKRNWLLTRMVLLLPLKQTRILQPPLRNVLGLSSGLDTQQRHSFRCCMLFSLASTPSAG